MSSRFPRVRVVLLAATVLVAMFALVMMVSADSIAVDFESYTLGTVDGQDGWQSDGAAGSGCAVYDHAVVNNTYGYASFGAKSLRMSNAVTSGCFGDQTFSKPTTNEAGETSAVSDGMSGGTRQPYFEAEWDFASTVPGAEQPGLSVVASPDRGDGARMSWVQMADKPAGLEVNFYDYDRTIDPTCTTDAFVFHNLVSGLARTVPHTIKITMEFVDGIDNDIVKVYVDGVLKITSGSWEDYFRDCEPNPTRPVDSILFRTGGTAAPATAGNGFVIDNLSVTTSPVMCTTLCFVDAAGGSDSNGGTSAADAFATIQKGIDTVEPGGEVRVLPGTYPESPTINKSLTLVSTGGRDVTFIALQTGTNYTHSMLISGAEVTVNGFTIIGIDAACPQLAATNIYLNTAPDNVVIQNNRFQVGAVGGCSTGDDGYGLITEYSGNPDVASLTVEGNIFEPLNTAGQRAFYINPSVVEFTFRDNEITGQFDAGSFSEAQDNLIEDNTITGTGASGGIGLWGYLDPGVWGTGTIQGNSISGTANAISLYETEVVTVTKNILDGNGRGVRVAEIFDTAFDQTTIHINRNSLSGDTTAGIANQLDQINYGDVDGECNWWGDAGGPGPVGPGAGSPVTADVDFDPWLGSSDLDGPCPAPPAPSLLYVSPNMKNGVVDGVPFNDQDILLNYLGTSDWEMFFDGSTFGINKNLTDFTFDAAGCLLMTFNGNQKIGATTYKPQDVAQFCPSTPGDYSAGTFSMYLDGSDVGLTTGGEIIDALEVLADGRLVISTKGNAKVPENASASILAQKNDLLVFNFTAYGPVSTGYWSMYLDNILVPGLNKENIISSYIDNGDKYMTFWANFTVGDETGDYNDIVVIHSDYSADVFWDADDYGYHGRIHGLHIEW